MRQLQKAFSESASAQLEHSELVSVPNTLDGITEFMQIHRPEELHEPAQDILALALERAQGIRGIIE